MRYKLRRKKEADDMYSTRNIQVFIPTIGNMEISSFLQLIQLHNQIVKIKKKLLMENKSISFNFSKCYNLQTNGIAYLGAISSWLSSQGILVSYNFNSMNKSVTNAFKNVGFLQKHFHNHFENEAIPSTAIDFEQFQGDIRSEVELNNRVIKYITDKWLSQNNILMMPKLKDDLKSKIFELFANALEHSGSNLGCFCCRNNTTLSKKQELTLTLIDLGIGIAESVQEYFKERKGYLLENNIEALKWAFEEGNTTRESQFGGLGLALVEDFLDIADGSMEVYCNNVLLQIKGKEKSTDFIPYNFQGTIINIRLHPTDGRYGYKDEFT